MKTFLVRSLTMALVLIFCFTGVVTALSPEQKRTMNSGVYYFNTEPDAICNTRSSSSFLSSASGSLYILGDSITVGATPAIQTAANANGLSIEKINAVVGRSINSGGEGGESGLQAINNDASNIAAASTVIVALGTNNGGDETDITNIIEGIRQNNVSARIFWVNVFSPGASGNTEEFNSHLESLSTELGFTVIDATNAKIELGSDNLHPTSSGQGAFAQTVLNALIGNSSTTVSASGCSCSISGNGGDRDTRYRAAWAYLTTNKGLSPEAAAGVMGNLEAESGIDPHNTQNNASAPDGPEIPIESIRGSHGYGIAQWTSAGRQDNLIAYARETNRSTGDLGLQIDFLWKELEESYTGVAAVLQTPGVTIAEASYVFLSEFEIPAPFTDRGTQAQRDRTTADRLAMSQAIYNEFSGQTIASTLGGGCGGSGANIDLVSQDTTNIPCATGTQDAGAADGYREGKLYRIRLCQVGSTRVNSQISGSVASLLSDSAAAGVNIGLDGAGGSFRTMEDQIDTYERWCSSRGINPTPPPYPKENWGDYVRCRGSAPPGYSNHQMGLGFDFVCDGQLIPELYADARGNRCFQWLETNASRYGLYEFGKGESRNESGYEGWHWSVDGG